MCRCANSLSNSAEWHIRHYFERTGEHLFYAKNCKISKHNYNYKMLNANIAQQMLRRRDAIYTSYFGLLKALKQRLHYSSYMALLAKENETERLMQQVRIHPDTVLTYGQILFPAYAEEIAQIGQKMLRDRGNHVSNRSEYQDFAGRLKRFAKIGAKKEALELLDQIRAEYPRKRALQEELVAARQSISGL